MHRIMYMASVHMLIILHNWSNSLGSPSLALPGFLIVYLSSPQQKSPCLFPLTWLPSSSQGKRKQTVRHQQIHCVCTGARGGGVLMHICACACGSKRYTSVVLLSALSFLRQGQDHCIWISGIPLSPWCWGERGTPPHQRLYVSSENLNLAPQAGVENTLSTKPFAQPTGTLG